MSPVYPQISEAIYNNVYAALQGDMSPDEAAPKMNDDIQTGARDVLEGTRWRQRPPGWDGAGLAGAALRQRRAAARGGDAVAVADRHRAGRGVPDRLRDLAVAERVQRPGSRASRASSASTTTPRRSARRSSGSAVTTTFLFTGDLGRASSSRSASGWRSRCTRRSRAAASCAPSCSCRGRCSRSSARSPGARSSSPNLGLAPQVLDTLGPAGRRRRVARRGAATRWR